MHPLLIGVLILFLVQGMLYWMTIRSRRNYTWDECPVCGAMLEMHREKTLDDEPIWKGSCDNCYNHVTQFIDYNA